MAVWPSATISLLMCSPPCGTNALQALQVPGSADLASLDEKARGVWWKGGHDSDFDASGLGGTINKEKGTATDGKHTRARGALRISGQGG